MVSTWTEIITLKMVFKLAELVGSLHYRTLTNCVYWFPLLGMINTIKLVDYFHGYLQSTG